MPLSRFTPSNHEPELLHALFVGRHRLLDAVVARVSAAVDSPERNHTLLVGPRGAGKTHLVSLAHARTVALQETGAAIQTSWPNENLYWITTYDELLAEIANALAVAIEGPLPRGWQELEGLLVERAEQEGTIAVFIENLDHVLDALSDVDQQRLRRFCQDDAALLFVATATSITRDLSDQAYPFYGFFTTDRLESFDEDTALAMLTRIAEHDGDETLVNYLETDEARSRVRAITHLAGGQPRVWSMLAAGLTAARLSELVDLLLTEFDNLTPFYQEQVGRLSPQQRRVANQLISADHPLHVSEIAERLGAGEKSIAKTISELRDRNWVIATDSPLLQFVDRRRTYYELAEPLARLAWQISAARGTPIELVIEFCKLWFEPGPLEPEPAVLPESYAMAIGEAGGGPPSLAPMLRRVPLRAEPTIALLGQLDDTIDRLLAGDGDDAMQLHHAVRSALERSLTAGGREIDAGGLNRLSRELNDRARGQFGNVPHPGMTAWIERTERLMERTTAVNSDDRARLANWHSRAWQFEAAEAIIATLPPMSGDDADTRRLRHNLAPSHQSAGRNDGAARLEAGGEDAA